MSALHARTPAGEGVDAFISHLASRHFAGITQRIRRHFLDEFLSHAQQATGTSRMTTGELMDPARADAWLADAAAGKTRTRNTFRGPYAAAGVNSMRVRVRLLQRLRRVPRPAGPAGQPAARRRRAADPGPGPAPAARPGGPQARLRQRRGHTAHRGRGRAGGRHRPVRARPGWPQGRRAASGWCGTGRAGRRAVPAARRQRADPHPVAGGQGGDHRRARGQRPRSLVDPGQARAAPGLAARRSSRA